MENKERSSLADLRSKFTISVRMEKNWNLFRTKRQMTAHNGLKIEHGFAGENCSFTLSVENFQAAVNAVNNLLANFQDPDRFRLLQALVEVRRFFSESDKELSIKITDYAASAKTEEVLLYVLRSIAASQEVDLAIATEAAWILSSCFCYNDKMTMAALEKGCLVVLEALCQLPDVGLLDSVIWCYANVLCSSAEIRDLLDQLCVLPTLTNMILRVNSAASQMSLTKTLMAFCRHFFCIKPHLKFAKMKSYVNAAIEVLIRPDDDPSLEVYDDCLQVLSDAVTEMQEEDAPAIFEHSWDKFSHLLVAYMDSNLVDIKRNAFIIAVNLTCLGTLNNLRQFCSTSLFDVLAKTLMTKDANILNCFKIISNMNLTEMGLCKFAVTSTSIFQVVLVTLGEIRENKELLHEALFCTRSFMKCYQEDFMSDFFLRDLNKMDVIFLHITKSQSSKVMKKLLEILGFLLEIGENEKAETGTDVNLIVKYVIESDNLKECLEQGMYYDDDGIAGRFYALIEDYFMVD